MAKFLVLFALCMLPAAIVSATNPFQLVGRAYCDTCRVGFETDASQYLPGTLVKLECKTRDTQTVTYTENAVTDKTGTYKISVNRDCGDEVCDVMLVKSSFPECSTPNAGRDRARVILTRNNGMTSDTRYANNLGFLKNVPLASCPQILQKYEDSEDV